MNIFIKILIITTCMISLEAYSANEIDQDINYVKQQLSEAKREAAKYKGGLILTHIKMRIAILNNSLAMLEQKRMAKNSKISLVYKIDGKKYLPGEKYQIDNIDSDIQHAEVQRKKLSVEASRYSGGLVLALKKSTIAQYESTIAALYQKKMSLKHGIPYLFPGGIGVNKDKPNFEIGNIVKDKDAL